MNTTRSHHSHPEGSPHYLRACLELCRRLSACRDLKSALDACLETALSVTSMDHGCFYLVDENQALVLTAQKTNAPLNHPPFPPRLEAESPQAKLVHANGIIIDITERIKAEEALKESETTALALLNATPDMMFLFSTDYRLLAANDPAVEWIGRPINELIDLKLWKQLPEKIHAQWRLPFRKVIQTGQPSTWPLKHNGNHFACSFHPIFDDKARVSRLALLMRDETRQQEIQAALLIHQERLRRMGAELLLAEERERRRIAGDLHDNIGQSLAMSKLKLKGLHETLTDAGGRRTIDDVLEMIRQMILATRSLTLELSPPILYELGLEAALEWLTEQVHDKHGIRTEFIMHGPATHLSVDIQILLFRAVRELLMNVVKHSGASQAWVSVRNDCDQVYIDVEDNGIGITDVERLAAPGSPDCFGLFSIRERLNSVGGHFKIDSEPGYGTRAGLTTAANTVGLGKKEM
jgi:two-component system, NarL family, sensor histidine kinase UhpB